MRAISVAVIVAAPATLGGSYFGNLVGCFCVLVIGLLLQYAEDLSDGNVERLQE